MVQTHSRPSKMEALRTQLCVLPWHAYLIHEWYPHSGRAGPFIIPTACRDYQYIISTQDELGVSHTLHLRRRVRRIDLHIPPLSLRNLLMLMDKSFPILESFSFSPRVEDDLNLILPTTFLAPSLHYRTLLGVGLPKGLPLLSSTASLVTLSLTDIRASGYFFPNYLATRLQSFPQPEELSHSFCIPILPRLSAERELFVALETPVMFPTLQCLTFQSIWKAYALPLLE